MELPISRADRATTAVRRRASPAPPYAVSRAPSQPERDEVGPAIDRWSNEGGFVPGIGFGYDG